MMPQDCCCAGRDRTNKKRGSNTDELENQICSWDFHSTGYVGANLCSAPWRRIAGRSIGPVSFDRGSVGDLRFAFCETEIGQSVQCDPETCWDTKVRMVGAIGFEPMTSTV